MVEPYIIIMSPLSCTPTLTASEAASMVPAVTGVPTASPVSAAARSVTVPAMSVVHNRSGSRSGETMRSANRSVQLLVAMS